MEKSVEKLVSDSQVMEVSYFVILISFHFSSVSMDFFQDLVDELYRFKDYYFENNSIDLASNFHTDIKNKMICTLDKLEAAKGQY